MFFNCFWKFYGLVIPKWLIEDPRHIAIRSKWFLELRKCSLILDPRPLNYYQNASTTTRKMWKQPWNILLIQIWGSGIWKVWNYCVPNLLIWEIVMLQIWNVESTMYPTLWFVLFWNFEITKLGKLKCSFVHFQLSEFEFWQFWNFEICKQKVP